VQLALVVAVAGAGFWEGRQWAWLLSTCLGWHVLLDSMLAASDSHQACYMPGYGA